MTHPTPRALFPILLLCLLVAGGCLLGGDSDPAEPGSVQGTVTDIDEGTPVAGAQAVLLDGRSYDVARGPVVVDDTGFYEFAGIMPGLYYVLVLAPTHILFDRTAPAVEVGPGETAEQDVRMMRPELWNGSGYRITGTVTDLDTGLPVAGAVVCGVFSAQYRYLYAGLTLPDVAVTDEAGAFELRGVGLTILADGDDGPVAFPFEVSKEGYDPFISPAMNVEDAVDSTFRYDVALDRADHTGSIRGRLIHLDDRPGAGITLGLNLDTMDWSGEGSVGDIGPAKQVPYLGKTTVSDVFGRYEFSGLTAGLYTVDAAFLPDDGYTTSWSDEIEVNLAEGESHHMPDIRLLEAIGPIEPAPGADLADMPGAYRWEPVPGADSYELWTTGGHIFLSVHHTEEAEFVPAYDPDLPHPALRVRWYVNAYRDSTLIGTFEEIATFTVDEKVMPPDQAR